MKETRKYFILESLNTGTDAKSLPNYMGICMPPLCPLKKEKFGELVCCAFSFPPAEVRKRNNKKLNPLIG